MLRPSDTARGSAQSGGDVVKLSGAEIGVCRARAGEKAASSTTRECVCPDYSPLVHRDWTQMPDVEVVSYADRLEVIGPGARQTRRPSTTCLVPFRQSDMMRGRS